jgi:hypothetical protein
MPPKERPPPRPDRGDGLENERLPDRLSTNFNDTTPRHCKARTTPFRANASPT